MKIAINGFGRIGKNITRHLIEAGYLTNQGGELELVLQEFLRSKKPQCNL